MNRHFCIWSLFIIFTAACSSSSKKEILVDPLPPEPGDPIIETMTDVVSDGDVMTITGTEFGTHPLKIEFLGGKKGPLETMPEGTELRRNWGPEGPDAADPNWTEPGWEAGSSTIDEGYPRISRTKAHSYDQSLSHYGGGDVNFMSAAWYRVEHDPEMAMETFQRVFVSSWVYFDPEKHVCSGDNCETGWKIMNVKHGFGTNVWEGEFEILGGRFDTQGNLGTYIMGMNALYTRAYECSWPCTAPITCKRCAHPGPPASASEAYDWEWMIRDSYGESSWMPIESYKWMRLDLYLQASSDFDTWDGMYHARLTSPDGSVNWRHRVEGMATHASDPLTEYGDNPPFGHAGYWDNVFNNVMWKNQLSGGPTAAHVYYDDHYIQFGTRARIEMGNQPNYKDCTKLEIQKPKTWTETEASFKLNHGGSFSSGDTAFLFLINSAGKASPGVELILK